MAVQGGSMERREFLKRSAQVGAAAWTAVSADQVMGANDRLRVGLIGCGGRGTLDARNMRGTLEDLQAVAPENYHGGNPEPRLLQPRFRIAAVIVLGRHCLEVLKRAAHVARVERATPSAPDQAHAEPVVGSHHLIRGHGGPGGGAYLRGSLQELPTFHASSLHCHSSQFRSRVSPSAPGYEPDFWMIWRRNTL